MSSNRLWRSVGLLVLAALTLAACAGEATPEVVGGFEIPAVEEASSTSPWC